MKKKDPPPDFRGVKPSMYEKEGQQLKEDPHSWYLLKTCVTPTAAHSLCVNLRGGSYKLLPRPLEVTKRHCDVYVRYTPEEN